MNSDYVFLLKRALPIIKSGKERFLCIAIFQAWSKLSPSLKRKLSQSEADLRVFICSRIRPYCSVTSWLTHQGFEGTDREYRDYRVRWIESLIKEFS